MSNYSAPARHPITGAIGMADWLDDSFGRHIYGVRFHGDDKEKIYPSAQCAEISPDEMLEEIKQLQAALMADAETLRLHLGEMTPQEMQTVKTAFAWALHEGVNK